MNLKDEGIETFGWSQKRSWTPAIGSRLLYGVAARSIALSNVSSSGCAMCWMVLPGWLPPASFIAPDVLFNESQPGSMFRFEISRTSIYVK